MWPWASPLVGRGRFWGFFPVFQVVWLRQQTTEGRTL